MDRETREERVMGYVDKLKKEEIKLRELQDIAYSTIEGLCSQLCNPDVTSDAELGIRSLPVIDRNDPVHSKLSALYYDHRMMFEANRSRRTVTYERSKELLEKMEKRTMTEEEYNVIDSFLFLEDLEKYFNNEFIKAKSSAA